MLTIPPMYKYVQKAAQGKQPFELHSIDNYLGRTIHIAQIEGVLAQGIKAALIGPAVLVKSTKATEKAYDDWLDKQLPGATQASRRFALKKAKSYMHAEYEVPGYTAKWPVEFAKLKAKDDDSATPHPSEMIPVAANICRLGRFRKICQLKAGRCYCPKSVMKINKFGGL